VRWRILRLKGCISYGISIRKGWSIGRSSKKYTDRWWMRRCRSKNSSIGWNVLNSRLGYIWWTSSAVLTNRSKLLARTRVSLNSRSLTTIWIRNRYCRVSIWQKDWYSSYLVISIDIVKGIWHSWTGINSLKSSINKDWYINNLWTV